MLAGTRRRSYTDQVLELYERGLPRRHAVVVQQNDVAGFTSIGSGGAKIAAAHGYDGWITSGAIRDTDDLRGTPWPVYGTSIVPAGRRVTDLPPGQSFRFTFDAPVDIDGMRVEPGEIVVGDNDGVIAIPPQHLLAILEEAEAILRVEHRYYRLIDEGRRSGRSSRRIARPGPRSKRRGAVRTRARPAGAAAYA